MQLLRTHVSDDPSNIRGWSTTTAMIVTSCVGEGWWGVTADWYRVCDVLNWVTEAKYPPSSLPRAWVGGVVKPELENTHILKDWNLFLGQIKQKVKYFFFFFVWTNVLPSPGQRHAHLPSLLDQWSSWCGHMGGPRCTDSPPLPPPPPLKKKSFTDAKWSFQNY